MMILKVSIMVEITLFLCIPMTRHLEKDVRSLRKKRLIVI